MDLYARNMPVKAELEFRNVLQIEPRQAEAWRMLGRLAEQRQDWRSAYSAYTRAVELSAENHEARVALGSLLLAAQRLDDALAQADAVLVQHPQDPSALALRGFVRLKRQDAAGARSDADAALQSDPVHREALALLTQIHFHQDNLPEAKSVLQSALRAHPDEKRFLVAMAAVSDRLGDAEGTRTLLQRLIALEPGELSHRSRLAWYLTAQGDLDDAEQVLWEAVSALPEDNAAKLLLIDFVAAQQGLERAADELGAFIDAEPQSHELRFALAAYHLQRGELDQARRQYRAIIRVDGAGPDGLRSRVKLAALALQQQHDEEARDLVAEVLEADARFADALVVRAALALRGGDAEQAIADLRTVLVGSPDSVAALRMLAEAHAARQELSLAEDALKRVVDAVPDDPTAYLRLAGIRERNGDSDGALAIIEALLSRQPSNAAAQSALARLQQTRPDTEALQETAERVLATRPEHPMGHYLQGLVFQRRGELEASVEPFEASVARQPRAVEPLVALVSTHLQLGQHDLAEQRLRQALAEDAEDWLANSLLGEVYLARGQLSEARAQFEKAIGWRPEMASAYERLARIQLAEGDASSAVETIRRGKAATSGSGLLASILPIALERSGRIDEAIDAYEAALAAEPFDTLAANNLAMLLADHRADNTESIARARSLVQGFEDSDDPALLDTLGWVYYRDGDYHRAVKVLKRVQGVGEMTPERQFHLGMVYLGLGRLDEARALLAAATEEGQEFPGFDQAKAALAAL